MHAHLVTSMTGNQNRFSEAIEKLKGALKTESEMMPIVLKIKTKLCTCHSKVYNTHTHTHTHTHIYINAIHRHCIVYPTFAYHVSTSTLYFYLVCIMIKSTISSSILLSCIYLYFNVGYHLYMVRNPFFINSWGIIKMV